MHAEAGPLAEKIIAELAEKCAAVLGQIKGVTAAYRRVVLYLYLPPCLQLACLEALKVCNALACHQKPGNLICVFKMARYSNCLRAKVVVQCAPRRMYLYIIKKIRSRLPVLCHAG